jgi:Rps23 Pro-64 3,4-dihydroxylase Tpa1-like proline 4-hydroxylase
LLPLLYRGAMLLGIPYTHVETVFVTRYLSGEYYKKHEDFFPGFQGDRLYTVLIYLNDLNPEQGGGTTFEKLRLAATPKCGRAISWTNRNPDQSTHPETTHEALPVAEGAEKWAIQLWFRRYELISPAHDLPVAPSFQNDASVAAELLLPPGVHRLPEASGS